MSPLERIRIVLVEPAGPRNVGSVARVMKNFGLTDLRVVKGPPLDLAECCTMAASAIDVLHRAQTPPTVLDAIRGCGLVAGTTARTRHRTVVQTPADAAGGIIEAAGSTDVAILFGREDDGLSADELALCQRVIGIETSPAYASLNLAQAAGIVAYEIFRAAAVPRVSAAGRVGRLLDPVWRELLQRELTGALDALELVPDATRDDYLASLRRILTAGPIQTRDARVLFALAKRTRRLAADSRPAGKAAPQRDKADPPDAPG